MAPRTLDSDTTPDARASDYDASNGSNASRSPGLRGYLKGSILIWRIRFGPGSESNASNESKVAPRTLDSDTTPDARASDSDAANGSNASQVLALGPTLDSLNSFGAFDSDQGPNRMHLIDLNSLALGPYFRFIRSIRFGPWSDSNAPN